MAEIGPYRICFVCSGNICRSPIAEGVMRELAGRAGLQISADSAGTGDWHVGERADLRALRALENAGYPRLDHRARQFDARLFTERDLIVALDAGHLRILWSLAPDDASRDRIRLLRRFDSSLEASLDPSFDSMATDLRWDVADPYYGDDRAFAQALRQIESACAGLIAAIQAGQLPRLNSSTTG